ncbi:MAG TPA: ABC transporter ATP-binding protein [Bacteroidetes bacterium]|nr:ABC transporter ATP-binding protein [Bacteroidota bacterium]
MAAHTPPVINVKEMTKSFGSFVAVDRLTFQVEKGEIFGFLGANGAGKTTAVRVLCGLSSPTSGQITVAGYDVWTQTEQVKRSIGYMSQRFSLYEDITVYENIRLFGGIYGLSRRQIRERAGELLSRLGLEHQRDALIASLPLGWRQKLAFSIAIIHRPGIVFLDEPTGGVDPITRRQFWDLIYETAQTGITVFVTTHYMDEAEYCDRLCVMDEGRIVAMDTPYRLKQLYGAQDMNEVFIKIARKEI